VAVKGLRSSEKLLIFVPLKVLALVFLKSGNISVNLPSLLSTFKHILKPELFDIDYSEHLLPLGASDSHVTYGAL